MSGFQELGATTIYQAFDIDGVLLYVGISKDVGKRLRQHEKSAVWWAEAVDGGRIEFAWVWGDRREVERYEAALIRSGKPVYNVTHNTNRPADQLMVRKDALVAELRNAEVWRWSAEQVDSLEEASIVKLWGTDPAVYVFKSGDTHGIIGAGFKDTADFVYKKKLGIRMYDKGGAKKFNAEDVLDHVESWLAS